MVALAVLLAAAVLVSGTVPLHKSQLEAWFHQKVKPCTERKGTIDHALLIAELNKRVIKVMKDGSGDCKTISDAIKMIPAGNTKRVIVHIGPGVYNEQVRIEKTKPFVTLFGLPSSMPNLTYSGGATVVVESEYFVASNIIFSNIPLESSGNKIDWKRNDIKSKGEDASSQAQKNSSPKSSGNKIDWERNDLKSKGEDASWHAQKNSSSKPSEKKSKGAHAQTQAQTQTQKHTQTQTQTQTQIQKQTQTHTQTQTQTQAQAQTQTQALKISGDKAAFYSCKFMGIKDTLHDEQGRHFFKDCTIQGALDFIYGSAKSLYLNSKVHVLADNGLTSIVAPDRSSKSKDTGFVFVHCDVTGTNSKTYLGRAWSKHPQAIYAYSSIGVINPAGWFKKLHPHQGAGTNTEFLEYMNQGPGAKTSKSDKFSKTLSASEAQSFISLAYIQASTWLLPAP
ncbi:hypothetical protein L6164_029132 [Bauhinia variegata]|uniref:Uncharacterized protein n=1 Tax=Bauhinia variegata TaxID=167791 RepID=A0ACB9L8S0_BAUVA|nr:hypothetical protein L6164_029132 [Bauhinia variegata]